MYDELILQLRYLIRLLGVQREDQHFVLDKFKELEGIINQLKGYTTLDDITEGRLKANKVMREIIKKVFPLPGYNKEYKQLRELFTTMFKKVTKKHLVMPKVCYKCGLPSGMQDICLTCKAEAEGRLRIRVEAMEGEATPVQYPVRYLPMHEQNPALPGICGKCNSEIRYENEGPGAHEIRPIYFKDGAKVYKGRCLKGHGIIVKAFGSAVSITGSAYPAEQNPAPSCPICGKPPVVGMGLGRGRVQHTCGNGHHWIEKGISIFTEQNSTEYDENPLKCPKCGKKGLDYGIRLGKGYSKCEYCGHIKYERPGGKKCPKCGLMGVRSGRRWSGGDIGVGVKEGFEGCDYCDYERKLSPSYEQNIAPIVVAAVAPMAIQAAGDVAKHFTKKSEMNPFSHRIDYDCLVCGKPVRYIKKRGDPICTGCNRFAQDCNCPSQMQGRSPKMGVEQNPKKPTQMHDLEDPIEIWKMNTPDGEWEWRVLKKYQTPEKESKNPYARWFCAVKSPYTFGSFDHGDVYIKEITNYATKVR